MPPELRQAIRSVLRSPRLSLAIVASLGLGLGVNTAVFSLVDALVLQGPRVGHPDRAVALFTLTGDDRRPILTSYPNFEDVRARTRTLSGLAALAVDGVSLGGGESDPVRVPVGLASENLFGVLDLPMALGRGFLATEGLPGAPPVAILSHRLWTSRFAADSAVIGRTIRVNQRDITVVGVLPSRFRGTLAAVEPGLYLPLGVNDLLFGTGAANGRTASRRFAMLWVYGRLRPGVTHEAAESELSAIAAGLAREHPAENGKRSIMLRPLAQGMELPTDRSQAVLAGRVALAMVLLVLFIACANVANLLLVRAASREREFRTRLALGATAGHLGRLLALEGLLLAAAATGLGLALGLALQRVLWSLRPPLLEADAIPLGLSPATLGFTALAALVTGVGCAAAPLMAARRAAVRTILSGGRPVSTLPTRSFRPQEALLAVQVALSLMTLVAALLFLRSMRQAERIDPGFSTARLVTLAIDLGAEGLDQAQGSAALSNIAERLRGMPGVVSAGVAMAPPLSYGFRRTVFPEGAEGAARDEGVSIMLNQVDDAYLRTMGIPLLSGRDFTAADREGAPMVAVINQTMAARLWPGQPALGRRFRVFGKPWVLEVIGVARDTRYVSLGEEAQPYFYLPFGQHYTPAVTIHLRTQGEPTALLRAVRTEMAAAMPGMPLSDVLTMDQIMDDALWAPRFGAWLLGAFGVLAMLLAAIGIHTLAAATVASRTREIGVRLALGAPRLSVVRSVLARGVTAIGLGLALGGVLAGSAARLVGALLYDLAPADPLSFVATVVVLALAAVAACYRPVRRALATDPARVLREE